MGIKMACFAMLLAVASPAFSQTVRPQCPPGMVYGSPTAGCVWRCYCPDGSPSPGCDPADCGASAPGPNLGACCLPNGCSELSVAQCRALLGTYLGDGVRCAGAPCPPAAVGRGAATGVPGAVAAGACCRADGTCQNMAGAECARVGGKWQGANTACGPDSCIVIAACCLPSGTCEMTTEAECLERHGGWRRTSGACNATSCAQACAGTHHFLDGRLQALSIAAPEQREQARARLSTVGRKLLLSGSKPAELFERYVDSCRALGLDGTLDWGSLVVLHLDAGGKIQETTASTDMNDWLRRVTPLEKCRQAVATLTTRPIPDAMIVAEARGADLACGE